MLISRFHLYKALSGLCFFFYISAVLFGPSGPQWSEKLEDVSEMNLSNPVNQVVYSTIFILAFLSILPYYKKFFSWLNNEKFIVLFLIWCGLTIFWAIDPFIAFKRYFQYLITSLVFISVLLNFKDEKIIIKSLTIILSIYLFVTLIIVLIIPQATDPNFNTWRGLHPTKNNLGQTASLCIIFFTYAYYNSQNLLEKSTMLFFAFIAIILLIGAFSMTNILLIFVFASVFFFLKVSQIFSKLGIGIKFLLLTLFFSLIIVLLVFIISPDIYVSIFELLGKDPTLTGRTEIWFLVLSASINDLILGVGFQSFWIPEHMITIELFKYWIPTQAHNGYIDIILETGIVGLILFLLSIFFVLRKASIKEDVLWILFIVFAVLLNFLESTFIRPHHLTNVLFYASFWILSYKRKVLNTLIPEAY